MKRRIIQVVGLVIAASGIIAGIMTSEVKTVFAKAIRICLECIGLGMVAIVMMSGICFSTPEIVEADTQRVVVCDDVSCRQINVTLPDEITIKKGESATINVSFDKVTPAKIKYKSRNKKKVAVTKMGVITAKRAGKAVIKTTVNCEGGKSKLVFKTVVNITK